MLFFMVVFLFNFVSASVILSDNFESGTLSGWSLSTIENNWTVSTLDPHTGTYHAYSVPTNTNEPASIMERIISTIGYENINFSYYRKLNLDVADEFQVEYNIGSGWTILEQTGDSGVTDSAYQYKSFLLPASAEDNVNFQIKFECTGGAVSDKCSLDNINLTGDIIDNLAPQIKITYPGNQNYSVNVSALNYTLTEPNLDKCWYSTNSGTTNITITCGNNVTGLISNEGTNTWTVWANDTLGNLNFSSVTFLKDTVKPLISITYPQNISYNINVSSLNFTLVENNPHTCWYSLNGGITNTTSSCISNLTGLVSLEGLNNWIVWANDTLGNLNFTKVFFTKDSIKPSFLNITENPSNASIYVAGRTYNFNITINESNIYSYGIDFNGTNYSVANNSNVYIFNISNLVAGVYSYYWWANDTLGNYNTSGIRNYFVLEDTEAPSIDIQKPLDEQSYGYNTSIQLNYTVVEDNLDSCWYNLNDGNNITLAGCINTTFDIAEGNNFVKVYANDTLGNEDFVQRNFIVDIGPPTITLGEPGNSKNTSLIIFYYTPEDPDGVDSCSLYGDFNGAYLLNQTDNSIASGAESNFSLNLSDEDYNWSISCNDSTSEIRYSQNKSFSVDTINPLIVLSEPKGSKTSRNSIPLTFSIIDNTTTFCWYNVFRGGTEEISNISISNCSSTNFGVTLDADFTLNLFVNDSAGNFNFTSSNFTVSTPSSSGGSSGGGGGGSSGGGGGSSLSSGLNLNISPVEAIVYPGEEKSLEVTVKNNAPRTVNKCRLKVPEEQKSWIVVGEQKNIGAGEIVEFSFILTLPSNAISPNITLECIEGIKQVPISISILKSSYNMNFLEINLDESNVLNIGYLITSERTHSTNLIFSVYSGKDLIAEEFQDVSLVRNEPYEGIIKIKLINAPNGVLKIAATSAGESKPLVEESIVYDSDLVTGFASLGILGRGTIIALFIIGFLFLVFTLFILRRIFSHKKRIKENKRISFGRRYLRHGR